MATALHLGPESARSGIVAITGRYRLRSDIASELKHVLADDPQIVVLDLHEVAGDSQQLSEVFDPVAPYLDAWPGTVLSVGLPDPVMAASLLPPAIINRILLGRSMEDGLERAREIVRPQQRTTTFLPPLPQAAEAARAFTRRTLRTWQLEEVMWPASLVVNELVTHSILEAQTALDLTLSRLDRRIRIAVHDFGSDSLRIPELSEPADPLEESLHHRGLLVVRALTRCWGVFPSRVHGKTVWAVMEDA